ncbi:hypothetical protein [Streptomyces sp. YIM S03343]
MSASPAVRSLRAAVFAAVCVLLAVAGHRLGTGVAPPVWVDGAGFPGVFGTAWVLGARERSLTGIGAVMLGTQGVLHVLFEAAGPSAAPDAVGGGMSRHAMGSSSFIGEAVGHVHEMCTPVAAAHLLAALVASWWLRRGEAAVWGILRCAVERVPSVSGVWRLVVASVALPPAPGSAMCAVVRLVPLRQALLRHAVLRRGPPRWVPYTN